MSQVPPAGGPRSLPAKPNPWQQKINILNDKKYAEFRDALDFLTHDELVDVDKQLNTKSATLLIPNKKTIDSRKKDMTAKGPSSLSEAISTTQKKSDLIKAILTKSDAIKQDAKLMGDVKKKFL